MTHQFKDCTIDLRGAGYACVSRGDEFEIGHTGEGDRRDADDRVGQEQEQRGDDGGPTGRLLGV